MEKGGAVAGPGHLASQAWSGSLGAPPPCAGAPPPVAAAGGCVY